MFVGNRAGGGLGYVVLRVGVRIRKLMGLRRMRLMRVELGLGGMGLLSGGRGLTGA
jgi:hypothetical protein